jgi:3-oxoacyl-[acyl-carrier-protein] synthase II
MHRRVVITGMGAVTPIGNDIESFWQGLSTGINGIAPIKAYDTTDLPVKVAAEVKLDIKEFFKSADIRKMDRFTMLAMIAAAEAYQKSGLAEAKIDLQRGAVLISSGVGGLSTIEKEQTKGLEKGFDRISPFFIPMTIANIAAGRIAINTGFQGYASSVVTACAGGSNALGDSLRLIRHGYADIAIAGGAEACITPLAVGGFSSMQALCTSNNPNRASIPFDLERSGFVIGEGAGVLILEELEHALQRKATIYAELTGYGTTCDAYHITAPEPEGKGGARAMEEALADAGLAAKDISYINAHGTSTPLNDKGETLAIKTVFGSHAANIPISSTKSMTGHLLGASGAIEAIACTLAINESLIPPTINYRVADPECDLDYVPNQARNSEIIHAMSNSFGFGGHNAALVISKYQEGK